MSDANALELPAPSRRRRILGAVLGLLIVLALGYAVARNRHEFASTWRTIGVRDAALALALGVVNGALTWLQWRTVLAGLGVRLDVTNSARVFFVSQLGKYLPGAVWPVVLQTESARRHGADRKSVFAANLIMIAVSLVTGLLLAGILLPFSVPSAITRFWWVLATIPLLVIAVHPSALPAVMDFGLRRFGRSRLIVRPPASTILTAMGWSTLAWIAWGAQTTILSHSLGGHGFGLFALCTGGTALAVSAGILFLPAPAGAGPREVVLLYVLGTVLSTGAALAVIVASRVLLLIGDVLMAAIGCILDDSTLGRGPLKRSGP